MQFISCLQADAPNHSSATVETLVSVHVTDSREDVTILVRQILLQISSFREDMKLILSDSETCLSTKTSSFYLSESDRLNLHVMIAELPVEASHFHAVW